MKKPLISPSILAADWGNLHDDIQKVKDMGADLIHIDVMDGVFVPNISIGVGVQKHLIKNNKPILPFDTHLMVMEPFFLLEQCREFQSTYITVHIEATRNIHRLIQNIRELGMKPGISLNPGTSILQLNEILPFVDLVLVMSVNPGFGGQKIIYETLNKITYLQKFREENSLSYLIQVDGGVKLENIGLVWESGADIVVSGSGIFQSDNKDIIRDMKNKYRKDGIYA